MFCQQHPLITLQSKSGLKSFVIDKSCSSSGPFQLMNIGDIDGDNSEEVAVLLFAGLNEVKSHFQIYSYYNNSWHLLKSLEYYHKDSFGPYIDINHVLIEDENYNVTGYINKNGDRESIIQE